MTHVMLKCIAYHCIIVGTKKEVIAGRAPARLEG